MPTEKMTELVTFRQAGGPAAVVFLHGFCGAAGKTWGEFPALLTQDRRLSGWDVYGVGYPTGLRVDILGLWKADPDLAMLAREFQTVMRLAPFHQYQALAVVAHSMGGLVAQQALLDADLAQRVSHVFLFGTPSDGLVKARFGGLLKQQARDMAKGSEFLKRLRAGWAELYAARMPFKMRVVAGDQDQFVPYESSLSPFPESITDVVYGDHLSIAKPTGPDSKSVELVVDGLLGAPHIRGIIDSALLAVELGQFKKAIGLLSPSADDLDDVALVQLALALEGSGRGEEALALLDRLLQGGDATRTDAMGTLAGRLKRRWLVQRKASDLQRAKALYAEALASSVSAGDADQAMYHVINIGFLEAMAAPASSAVPEAARAAAQQAMVHATDAKSSHWREATIGEAQIILGDLNAAALAYARAMTHNPPPRHADSMHSQATILATHVFGAEGAVVIDTTFKLSEP